MSDDIEPLDEEISATVTRQAERIVMLEHVINVQGRMIDDVATAGRKFKLSGNPGVSAAGAQILGLLVTD